MKLLIAVLLSIIIIISSTPIDEFNQHRQQALDANGTLAYIQEDSLNSVNSMDGLVQSNFSLPSSSFRLRRRRRRQIDEAVTTVVERMQMIARLINAIYLQKALINGTVNAETLISELLHFGSVSPAQIHAIKLKDVEDALNLFKALPSKLVSDKDMAELEEFYEKVDEVLREVEGLNDLMVWADKQSYKGDISDLVKGTAGDFTFPEGIQSSLGAWKYNHETLAKADGGKLTTDHKTFFSQLGIASKSLIDAGNKLTTELPELFEFRNGKTATESVRFVDQLINGARKVKDEKLVFPAVGLEQLNKNLVQVKIALKAAKSVQTTVDLVTKMFSSRSSLNSVTSPVYTISLPDGYDDITRMLDHFNNPWFLSTVKDARLGDSFKSLKSLDAVTLIDKLLESNGGSKQKSEVMTSLLSTTTGLVNTFSSYDMGDKSTLEDCFENLGSTAHKDDKVKIFVSKAEDIDKELKNLQTYLGELRTKLTQPDFVKNQEKFVTIGSKVNDDPATWKTAFKEFDDIKNQDAIVKQIGDIFNIAHKVKIDELKKLAAEVDPLFAEFDKFFTDAKNYVDFLSCLLKDQSAKPTINVIGDLKNLRNKKKEHEGTVSKALDVVKTVDTVKKDLKVLDTSIKGINNFKSKESDLLYTFKDSEGTYKTIGPAVRGIECMKLAIKEKSKIDVITSESATVEAELRNAKKQLSNEDKTRLNELVTLGTSLNTMYQQLNTWGGDVKSLSFKNLSDYSNVFVKAKGVTGLNVDLGAISESLEKLIKIADPSSQGKLRDVKGALNHLNGMGMQFASYSKTFDGTKKSLTDLDLFLSSFASLISVTPPPPPNSQNAGSGGSFIPDEREQEMSMGKIIGIAFGALAVLGLIIVASYFICCFKNKGKTETFQRSNKAVVQFRTNKKQALKFIEELIKEVMTCKGKKDEDGIASNDGDCTVDADGLTFKIDFIALFDSTHANHAAAMQDLEYVFPSYFFAWCDINFNAVNDDQTFDISPFVKEHEKELRQLAELADSTRVKIPLDYKHCKFETDFLHANFVQQKNNFLMVLTQGPQIATKNDAKLPKMEKLSTMEKFWYMVYINKFEAILMLCQLIEGGVQQCDEYFPPTKGAVKQFGPFKIKCTAIINDPDFVQRTLTVSVEGETATHTLTQFQYLSWQDLCPRDATKLIRNWKQARDSPHGAVIHCSDGIGRTGTTAYLEELYQSVYYSENGKIAHQLVFGKLREKRNGCVKLPDQMAFAYYALFEFLFDDLTDLSDDDRRFLELMRDTWREIRSMRSTEVEKTEVQDMKRARRTAIESRRAAEAKVKKETGVKKDGKPGEKNKK